MNLRLEANKARIYLRQNKTKAQNKEGSEMKWFSAQVTKLPTNLVVLVVWQVLAPKSMALVPGDSAFFPHEIPCLFDWFLSFLLF